MKREQTDDSPTRMRVVIAGAPGSVLTAEASAWAGVPAIERRLTPDDVKGADVLISAAHHHFIGERIRSIPKLGAVGLHPSLLPCYRGSYPLWWALRNGESEVGLTLFHLVDAIDAGAIIDRRVVPVERGDTFAELYARVAVAVRPMLTRMAAYVAEHGQLPAGTAQDETLASVYATPPRLQRAIYKTWWALRR